MKLHALFCILSMASLAVFPSMLHAQAHKQMSLWPKGAPGEKGDIGAEVDTTKPDQDKAGQRVIRLGNVTDPTLTVYKPAAGKDTGAAVVVFPGGGYNILAMDLEGTELCEWLNSIGVTGILVKYRVPAQPESPRGAAPLQDAQRAMRLARAHASEWHINPARIGVMGFSAGGHLAALVSNNFNKPAYEPVDAADQSSARPDFTMLIYPAYLAADKEMTAVSPALPVSDKTPPTLLVQAEDDPIPVEGVLVYYRALKNAKVPAEMHLYPAGGHGYGLRSPVAPLNTWPKRAEEWMRASGLLTR
jgi:acetyl esterase/lipase